MPSRRVPDRPASGWTCSPSSPRWSSTTARRPSSDGPVAGGLLDLRTHDIRDATHDVHRTVDDAPVRGRCRHGARPRAGLRGGRGGRCRPRTGCPAPCCCCRPRAGGFDQAVAQELAGLPRRLLPAVRPLRGRRPAGGRPPLRRRAVDRRLRAGRGRAGRPGGGRGRGPAPARRAGQRASPPTRRASPRGCSSTRSTPVRPTSGATGCPTCCARGTTVGWRPGGGRSPWSGRCRRRPDLIAARGGLTAEEVRLLAEHGEVRLLREHGYD